MRKIKPGCPLDAASVPIDDSNQHCSGSLVLSAILGKHGMDSHNLRRFGSMGVSTAN